jgi:ribonuclease M5
MLKVREVVVVEGRYDKNTLSQLIDGTIVETSGFGIFSDKEKLALFRRLAETRGLVVLTDSDGAGFVIRNYLKGAIDPRFVKHAYIPDIAGKERRKSSPSKEGKLGVEGMRPETLIEALRNAGVDFGEGEPRTETPSITKADLYALGLTGGSGSREKRLTLLGRLGLPGRLTANALLEVLNLLMTREAFFDLMRESDGEGAASSYM